jgi:hypothetical protein
LVSYINKVLAQQSPEEEGENLSGKTDGTIIAGGSTHKKITVD